MSLNSFASINNDDPQSAEIFKYRENNMCDSFKCAQKDLPLCFLNLVKSDNQSFIVNGNLKGDVLNLSNKSNLYLKFWAANSPSYNSNFSGSGLPFPNAEVAFDQSSNIGTSNINNGKFSFSLNYPNSYYSNMGTVYVKPEVQIQVYDAGTNKAVSEVQHINLGEGIPFRTLTYPYQRNWNEGPLLYKNTQMPAVRTQEQILVSSAYPSTNTMPKNFWGKKPPC